MSPAARGSKLCCDAELMYANAPFCLLFLELVSLSLSLNCFLYLWANPCRLKSASESSTDAFDMESSSNSESESLSPELLCECVIFFLASLMIGRCNAAHEVVGIMCMVGLGVAVLMMRLGRSMN